MRANYTWSRNILVLIIKLFCFHHFQSSTCFSLVMSFQTTITKHFVTMGTFMPDFKMISNVIVLLSFIDYTFKLTVTAIFFVLTFYKWISFFVTQSSSLKISFSINRAKCYNSWNATKIIYVSSFGSYSLSQMAWA